MDSWNYGKTWQIQYSLTFSQRGYNKNIYGLGVGIPMVFEILGLICRGVGWGIPLEEPRSMSLNVSYHKEQEYIWFRGGYLSNF